MHVFGMEMKSIGQILLIGLILGAGLPTLFAAGVRSMAWGAGRDVGCARAAAPRTHALGRILGIVCFVVVLACVALGITYIVASGFGKALSFQHVFPTIVDKS